MTEASIVEYNEQSPPISEIKDDPIYLSLYLQGLIKKLSDNDIMMDVCIAKIHQVMREFPPARNENKFIYGKVIEKILIYFFHQMEPCRELDLDISCGSMYKNDVIFLESGVSCSIKVSKNGTDVILVNKKSSAMHPLDNTCFIICVLKTNRIYFIVHTKEEFDGFVKDDHGTISYKKSIFAYMESNHKDMIYQFPDGPQLQSIMSQYIPERNLYEQEFSRIMNISQK